MTKNDPAPPESTLPLGRLSSIVVVSLISCLLVIDALTHAQPLALPLLSAALTIIGFAWAAIIMLGRSETSLPDRLVWPSLILFFGFAAAMLSDADQLVAHLQTR